MGDQAAIGIAVLAALVVGAMLCVRVLARIAAPYRVCLFENATELLHDRKTTELERYQLNYFMDHALSFSAGWTVLDAGFRALKMALNEPHHHHTASAQSDNRLRLARMHFIVSALSANPIAFAVFLPTVLLIMIVERERAKAAIHEAADQVRAVAI